MTQDVGVVVRAYPKNGVPPYMELQIKTEAGDSVTPLNPAEAARLIARLAQAIDTVLLLRGEGQA